MFFWELFKFPTNNLKEGFSFLEWVFVSWSIVLEEIPFWDDNVYKNIHDMW